MSSAIDERLNRQLNPAFGEVGFISQTTAAATPAAQPPPPQRLFDAPALIAASPVAATAATSGGAAAAAASAAAPASGDSVVPSAGSQVWRDHTFRSSLDLSLDLPASDSRAAPANTNSSHEIKRAISQIAGSAPIQIVPRPAAASAPSPPAASIASAVPPTATNSAVTVSAADMEAMSKRVFIELQPLCVALMDVQSAAVDDNGRNHAARHPTYIAVLNALIPVIERAPPYALNRCFEYVYFPLSHILSNPKLVTTRSDELHELVLRCLAVLLSRVATIAITRPAQLSTIFHLLIPYLEARKATATGTVTGTGTATATASLWSEEIRTHAVTGLIHVLSAVPNSVSSYPILLTYLCSPLFRVPIGYLLSILLNLSSAAVTITATAASGAATSATATRSTEQNKNRQLRILTLQTISVVLSAFRLQTARTRHKLQPLPPPKPATGGASGSAPSPVAAVADEWIDGDDGSAVAANFFPGIVSALCGVIRGDSKQGSGVVCHAIQALTDAIVLVTGDQSLIRGGVIPDPSDTKQSVLHGLNALRALTKQPLVSVPPPQPAAAAVATAKADTKSDTGGGDKPNIALARSREWLTSTAERLRTLLPHIYSTGSVLAERSSSVRVALVTSAQRVIADCANSLSESIPVIIQFVISAAEDDHKQVSTPAVAALASFTANPSLVRVYAALEESFHTQMTALPRVLRSGTHAQKLSALRMMSGYIRLLGGGSSASASTVAGDNRLSVVWNSSFERLSVSLLHALEIDVSDIRVLERVPIVGSAAAAVVDGYYETRFVHATTDETRYALLQICRLIGFHAGTSVNALFDRFIDLLVAGKHVTRQKEIVLLISQLLIGARDFILSIRSDRKATIAYCESFEPHVRRLIDEYLSPERWNRPSHRPLNSLTAGNDSETASPAADKSKPAVAIAVPSRAGDDSDEPPPPATRAFDANSLTAALFNPESGDSKKSVASVYTENAIAVSLLVRGLGDAAQLWSGESESPSMNRFAPLLMDVLYPLMDKLADPHPLVSQSALVTLQRIVVHLQYASLSALVLQNADYLVDAISSRLRAFRSGGSGGGGGGAMGVFSDSLSLPRVLRALLERTGAGPALIPLLDDTLQSILESLTLSTEAESAPVPATAGPRVSGLLLTAAEQRERQQQQSSSSPADTPFGPPSTSEQSGTFASLQVLLSIVTAISQQTATKSGARSASGSGGTSELSATRRLELRSAEAASLQQRIEHFKPETVRSRMEKLATHLRDTKRDIEHGIEVTSDGSKYFEERVKQKEAESEAKQKRRAAGEGGDDDADDKSAERSSSGKDDPPAPTREQQIVVDIIHKCRHFLSSSSIRQQYLVLSIIAEAVTALADAPNQLLPAIAKIWDPFKLRFTVYQRPPAIGMPAVSGSTRHQPIFVKSLEVLEAMSRHCPQFLSARFGSDAWPLISLVLKDEQRASDELAAFSSPHAYEQSSSFRVQMSALRALSALLEHAPDLIRKQVSSIAHLCTYYLSAYRARPLRDVALRLYQLLSRVDSDVVWFVLVRVSGRAAAPATVHTDPLIAHANLLPLAIQSSAPNAVDDLFRRAFDPLPRARTSPPVRAGDDASSFRPVEHAAVPAMIVNEQQPRNEYSDSVDLLLRQIRDLPEPNYSLY